MLPSADSAGAAQLSVAEGTHVSPAPLPLALTLTRRVTCVERSWTNTSSFWLRSSGTRVDASEERYLAPVSGERRLIAMVIAFATVAGHADARGLQRGEFLDEESAAA